MKVVFFILLVVIGSKAYNQTIYDQTKKIRFDPQQALGGDVSDLIDSVQYIPLETTRESTFGAISNLQLNDKYFVFFDFDTKAVYVFSRTGAFVGKINQIPLNGWNKNEYYDLSRFTFNKLSNDIYIIFNDRSMGRKWLLQFDINCKFIEKSDLTKIGERLTSRFSVCDDGSFLFSNSLNLSPLNNQGYFYRLRNFHSIQEELLPLQKNDIFLKRDSYRGYNLSSYSRDGSIWNRLFDYTFLILKGKKATKYDIILPAYMSLDSTKYRDTAFFNKTENVLKYCQENKIVHELHGFGITNNYLLFKTISGHSVTMKDNFIVTLQTNNVYSFDKISSDERSYFLPIGDVEIGAFQDGFIYNEVASYRMFEAAKDRPDKPWIHNSVLNSYFLKEDRKSNPVIVALKLKDTL